MSKLIILGSPFANVYNPNEAYIDIAYGTEEKPEDHKGRELSPNQMEFADYLIKYLIPKIMTEITTSKFRISKDIDYPNNSSMPALVFTKNDRSHFNDDDLTFLRKTLERNVFPAINPDNAKKSVTFAKDTKLTSDIFKKHHPIKKQVTSEYQTRSKTFGQ